MHWWQMFADDFPGSFNASGYEGQYTIVVPSLDLVAVRLGQTTADDHSPTQHLLAGSLIDIRGSLTALSRGSRGRGGPTSR